MKVSDLKPKHLVLGQEYDDFSKATDRVDFSKEDLACQVVGLTSVYYWINTESVWGPLGFVWDVYNEYGHFSKSTIDFNYIPKIPDSHRHATLKGTFNTINRNLIFLDSGWNHITDFYNLYNRSGSNIIDWYCDSLSNIENNINVQYTGSSRYNEHYILRGSLDDTTVSYPCNVHLILENKNKLNLNLVTGNNDVCNIYVDDIISDIDKTKTFDIRKYVKFDRLYTGYNSYFMIYGDISNFENLIFECYKYYGNKGVIYIGNREGNSDNVFEKVTYILQFHNFKDESISIDNSNSFKSKSFEYINIDNSKYSDIDIYFRYGIFENGTPQITKQILDFTTGSVFANCEFFLPYKYGSVKCTQRIFSNCYDNGFISKPCYGISFAYTNSTDVEITFNGDTYDVYESTLFNYIYTKDDYDETNKDNDRKISIPEKSGLYGAGIPVTFYFYDLKTDYIPYSTKGSNTYRYVTSVGEMEYFNTVVNTLIIFPNNKPVIFNEGTGVVLGWTPLNNSVSYSALIVKADKTKPIQDKFIFHTNRDNITNRKGTTYNTSYLWKICKNEGINIPYIIRNSQYAFVYNSENDKIAEHRNTVYKQLLPTEDTDAIIYCVNIDFTRKKNPIDNNVVQHILDSIITIGNIDDSKDKTIKILTEYYQSMKESTKEKLIGDGYTIIEVI